MEYHKIINLLDDTPKKTFKFRKKKMGQNKGSITRNEWPKVQL